MKSFIAIALLFLSSQALAVCQIGSGTINLPTLPGVFAPAQQTAFRCNEAGVRNASGNRVCVQFLSTVYSNATASYLHGQVLILDRNDGELVDMKRLYVGEGNAPAGSVAYTGNRAAMTRNLCANYVRERSSGRDAGVPVYRSGRNMIADWNVRPACLCGECSAAETARAANFDLFQYSPADPRPNEFEVPQSRGTYQNLPQAKRNRLMDLANGFVPADRCPDRRGLYYYLGNNKTQNCYNILNDTANSNRLSTISSVFSPASRNGSSGGTFARVLNVIEQARSAMRCEPSARTATRRSSWGTGTVGNRYDGTRQ